MQTIFLEFQWEGSGQLAAIGTDSIFYRDGRWSERTFRDKCHERAAEITKRKGTTKLQFVGYTTRNSDRLVRL